MKEKTGRTHHPSTINGMPVHRLSMAVMLYSTSRRASLHFAHTCAVPYCDIR
jgi:hypothetical protein